MTPIVGAAVGTGMGILQGEWNAMRGYSNQKRLQALQIRGQKEMMDYNAATQLDIWNKTNIGAQVEHYKKAGMNPALMYGMGGGGGTTTGSPTGNVTGATASQGQGADFAMGMQLGLLDAQKKNIEADTKVKEADAQNKAGVEREATQAKANLLAQELDNSREDYNIKRLQQTMMNIQNFEQQKSQGDRLQQIEALSETALKQLRLIANQTQISDATIQEQIQLIQRHAIGAALQNELTRTQKAGIQSTIKVNDQQINNFIQNNMREWDKMSQTNKELAIKQLLGEYNTDPVNDAVRNISGLIDNIFFISPKMQNGRTVVEGFKRY